MPKNETVQRLQRKKKDKTSSKDQPVQEVQKNKMDSTSTDAKTESEKPQYAADRVHPIQQEKPDHHNEGSKNSMETYQKLKCVYCGY